MKALRLDIIRATLLAAAAGVTLTGCSILNTASEGIGTVTDFVSSTTPDSRAAAFVDTRFAAIRAQAARGAGEDLDALASLRGEADRVEFARFMQVHYGELFHGLAQPRELLVRLDRYRGRA